MMKKVWLVLLAVVLIFGLALLGCGGKKSGTPEPEEEDDDLVETVVFELLSENYQSKLTVGALTIADDDKGVNPIDPLVKAGNTGDHVEGWQVVENEGKKALQYN